LNQCKKTKNLIVFAIDVSTIDCLGSLKRAVENKRKFNLRKLSWGENKSNIANPPLSLSSPFPSSLISSQSLSLPLDLIIIENYLNKTKKKSETSSMSPRFFISTIQPILWKQINLFCSSITRGPKYYHHLKV